MLDAPRAKARLGGLRPALVAGLVVGLAGSAGAAYGVSRLIGGTGTQRDAAGQEGTPSPEANEATVVTPGARSPQNPAKSLASPRPTEAPQSDGTPPDAETTPSPPHPIPRVNRTHSGDQPADPRLLHQAVEALRTAEDPKKAAELLQEYQRSGPTGALHEEALALSIEAALANDDPKAQELARRYLAEYPQGRFRRLALKAIGKEQARR